MNENPNHNQNHNQNAPCVLLLDDNLMSSARIVRRLEGANYRVITARDARSLAASTCSDQWACILINLGSRSLNGVAQIESCRELFPKVRVWGFCGHLEIEIRRAAKAAGIDRLLTNEQVFNGEGLTEIES